MFLGKKFGTKLCGSLKEVGCLIENTLPIAKAYACALQWYSQNQINELFLIGQGAITSMPCPPMELAASGRSVSHTLTLLSQQSKALMLACRPYRRGSGVGSVSRRVSAESRRPRPGAGGSPAYKEPLSDSELRLEAALLRVLQKLPCFDFDSAVQIGAGPPLYCAQQTSQDLLSLACSMRKHECCLPAGLVFRAEDVGYLRIFTRRGLSLFDTHV